MKRYHFIFCRNGIMLERLADGTYAVPRGEEPPADLPPVSNVISVTAPDGAEAAAWRVQDPPDGGGRYELCDLRQSYYRLPYTLYKLAGKCRERVYWDENSRFCGACGAGMKMHTSISKICSKCGKEVWPQLSPAVIVLVHRGKDVLLVHAKNFRGSFFGLVAGFVETGETLEEAVHREVKEETGLEIKNLRYFGSQPWPYPCGLMIGFNADYAGGTLRLQKSELSAGAWFGIDDMPQMPEKLSIARRLIDAWLDEASAK